MTVFIENDEWTPLSKGNVDGMWAFMDGLDEPTSTTWDLSCENPPQPHCKGYMSHPELAKK